MNETNSKYTKRDSGNTGFCTKSMSKKNYSNKRRRRRMRWEEKERM